MNRIKCSALIVLLFIAFVLNSELYQQHINSFSNGLYYINVTVDEHDCHLLPSFINDISNKLDVPFYIVQYKEILPSESKLDIYCTDSAYELLSKKQVKPGVFEAPVSGKISVEVHDIIDLNCYADTYKVYFSSANQLHNMIFLRISSCFSSGYVHIENGINYLYISKMLFLCLFFIHSFLSYLECQFRKKEIANRLLFGESNVSLIVRYSLVGAVVLFAPFIIIYLLMKQFFYIGFNNQFLIIIVVLCVMVSTSQYFFSMKLDYKRVFGNGHIGESLTLGYYVLKVFTTLLTTLVICVNMATVMHLIDPLMSLKQIEKYYDYEILFCDSKNHLPEAVDSVSIQSNVALNGYENNQAIISYCEKPFDNDFGIIFTNNMDFVTNEKMREAINKTTVIIPRDYNNYSDKHELFAAVYSLIKSNTGLSEENLKIDIIYANDNYNAIYFDFDSDSPVQAGYGIQKNPVVVYIKTGNLNLSSSNIYDVWESKSVNAIYKSDFLNRVCISSELNNIETKRIALGDYLSQKVNKIFQMFILSLTVICFQIALNSSLTKYLIEAEYMVKSKELIIMKIMGYRIFQKNRSIVFLNLYSCLIGIITSEVLLFLLQMGSYVLCAFVGVVLLMIELLILMFLIIRFEESNAIRILKGGAL